MGGGQASFTAKELRELLNLEGVRVVVPPEALALSSADESEIKLSRRSKRVYEVLSSASTSPRSQS